MKKPKKMKPATAWAWALHPLGDTTSARLLCFWAEPNKEMLLLRGRPTEDAIPVRVRIIEAPKRAPKRRRR